MRKSKNRKQGGNGAEARFIKALDQYREFEAFKETVLPSIQQDLYEGKLTASELYKKYEALAAARAISIAATEEDSGKAISAIKDILDRSQGRAVEKREVNHRFENLSDEELEALVMTEETDLKEGQNESN